MCAADSILEVLYKEITDGFYGLYKETKDLDIINFEYHYVGDELINFATNEKVDLKEGVDNELLNNVEQPFFKGTLKKTGDNEYTFVHSRVPPASQTYNFSFVKDEPWVERTIVLK